MKNEKMKILFHVTKKINITQKKYIINIIIFVTQNSLIIYIIIYVCTMYLHNMQFMKNVPNIN